ncbi:hypothetical protein [Streptomyces sp. NPDC012888]|uniref:hypothetical protein n=1 Tax=Streptomyces sp. NPDC012888 TaxID=3364855 RepID=UPI00369B2DB4
MTEPRRQRIHRVNADIVLHPDLSPPARLLYVAAVIGTTVPLSRERLLEILGLDGEDLLDPLFEELENLGVVERDRVDCQPDRLIVHEHLPPSARPTPEMGESERRARELLASAHESLGAASERSEPPTLRYAFVTVDGTLALGTATMPQIRQKVGAGTHGETGTEFVSVRSDLAAYHLVPYETDTRRMNKVANGMFWELSDPAHHPAVTEDDDPDAADASEDRPDRVIKMRGPVAFIRRGGMSPEDEAMVKEAYERAHGRLRSKGWI